MKNYFLGIFWGVICVLLMKFVWAMFGGDANGWQCGWFCCLLFWIINDSMWGKNGKER